MKTVFERKKVTFERSKPTFERSKPSFDRNQPDFESVFDDGDDNPFADLEQTGDLQTGADETMSEALRQIIEKKKATQERFRVATDSEFFFCMCFQSRQQKDAFLEALKLDDLGDKYINGLEVARRLGVPLEVVPIEPLKIRGKVKHYGPDDILKKGGDA